MLGVAAADSAMIAILISWTVAYPGIFVREGVQQIQLRTEDRERGSGGR